MEKRLSYDRWRRRNDLWTYLLGPCLGGSLLGACEIPGEVGRHLEEGSSATTMGGGGGNGGTTTSTGGTGGITTSTGGTTTSTGPMSCTVPADCDDPGACFDSTCESNVCGAAPKAAGTACGGGAMFCDGDGA